MPRATISTPQRQPEEHIGAVSDVSCPVLAKIGEAFAYAKLSAYRRNGPDNIGEGSRMIQGAPSRSLSVGSEWDYRVARIFAHLAKPRSYESMSAGRNALFELLQLLRVPTLSRSKHFSMLCMSNT